MQSGAARPRTAKEQIKSTGDKTDNAAEDLGGKAKEAAGEAADVKALENEGHADQTEASVKKVSEDV